MRLCNNAVLAALLLAAGLVALAQPAPASGGGAQSQSAPPLTVDTDPVRSPDVTAPVLPGAVLKKQGEGFLLHTDVEEVVLNATVLDGSNLVQNLTKDNFTVYEDGVKQTLHQLSAHRSAGIHGAGDRQLGVDVHASGRR